MDPAKDSKVLHISPRRTTENNNEGTSLQAENWDEEYFNKMTYAEDAELEQNRSLLLEIPIEEISVSPFQTRSITGDDELEELKNSILSRGVLQPIMLRKTFSDAPGRKQYELIAGERRMRAARLAGLEEIPAIVYDFDDQKSVEVSIIENAQRENLNPIEEAQAYLILSSRFGLSHAEIAKTVGKNRATVSNSLRLLQLEPEIIELLRTGELTAGHGRALLMIEDAALQLKLARLAVRKGLSVRTLEGLVSRADAEYDSGDGDDSGPDEKELQALRRMETKIGGFLGIEKVNLRADDSGARRLTLQFDTEAAWKRFMSRIRD